MDEVDTVIIYVKCLTMNALSDLIWKNFTNSFLVKENNSSSDLKLDFNSSVKIFFDWDNKLIISELNSSNSEMVFSIPTLLDWLAMLYRDSNSLHEKVSLIILGSGKNK